MYNKLVKILTSLASNIAKRTELSKLWLSLAMNAGRIVDATLPNIG